MKIHVKSRQHYWLLWICWKKGLLESMAVQRIPPVGIKIWGRIHNLWDTLSPYSI